MVNKIEIGLESCKSVIIMIRRVFPWSLGGFINECVLDVLFQFYSLLQFSNSIQIRFADTG